ncbi:MAG: hypothetical protein NTW08_03585 [Gammaproteobacteria bacterium]|nr:hypothetical protein [Gammaproteobacteria bacterium]
MCFSATASFTAGSLLIATGAVSVTAAFKNNKNYLLFACMPVIFGIQQCIEGLVWSRLVDPSVHLYALIYLFFAFYFWPAYVPICAYSLEKNKGRKKIIKGFMIAGQLLGIIMYAPILFGAIPLTVSSVDHSILYQTYSWGPLLWTYGVCYIFILTGSFLLSSLRKVNLFGVITFISVMISYWWYLYAFTSIWCFFCAILSFYITYTIYTLPASTSQK